MELLKIGGIRDGRDSLSPAQQAEQLSKRIHELERLPIKSGSEKARKLVIIGLRKDLRRIGER